MTKPAELAVQAIKWTAIGAGVYGVIRVGFLVSDAVQAGKKVLPSILEAAGEVVTRDLNPMNPDNVAARTVNLALTAATGRETSLGSLVRDVQERVTKTGAYTVNVSTQDAQAKALTGNLGTQASVRRVDNAIIEDEAREIAATDDFTEDLRNDTLGRIFSGYGGAAFGRYPKP